MNSGLTQGDYVFPQSAVTVGWLCVAFCIVWIPIYALYAIWTTLNHQQQQALLKPTSDWAPSHTGICTSLGANGGTVLRFFE